MLSASPPCVLETLIDDIILCLDELGGGLSFFNPSEANEIAHTLAKEPSILASLGCIAYLIMYFDAV